MTIEEKWAKLSPEERDDWIAKDVMEWRLGGPGEDFGHARWFTATGKDTEYWTTEGASQECPGFSPSTDIAAAWGVFEYLKTLGWSLGYLTESEDGGYVCQLLNIANNRECGAWGPTASDAICIAALVVVEAKV